jgi:hypothetical protein
MTTENSSAAVDVETAGRTLQVVFRPDAGPLLAGGPAYLDGTVSLVRGDPVGLLASAARATGRSREYVFTADGPGGTPLRDPFADAIEIGGIETPRPLTTSAPVTEHLLLNQFLTLEDLRDGISDGDSTDLIVECSRVLRLEGVPQQDAPRATAAVHLLIRRDDATLARYYRQQADAIMATQQFDVMREQRLTELFSARTELARHALSSLTDHPDGYVAARARQALAALS